MPRPKRNKRNKRPTYTAKYLRRRVPPKFQHARLYAEITNMKQIRKEFPNAGLYKHGKYYYIIVCKRPLSEHERLSPMQQPYIKHKGAIYKVNAIYHSLKLTKQNLAAWKYTAIVPVLESEDPEHYVESEVLLSNKISRDAHKLIALAEKSRRVLLALIDEKNSGKVVRLYDTK